MNFKLENAIERLLNKRRKKAKKKKRAKNILGWYH
jgi:hypothetical protein